MINLPAGSVQGVRTAYLDTFYGLPFAAAPVADLRWSPPSHLASWGTTVFDATSQGASCVASLSYTANDASQRYNNDSLHFLINICMTSQKYELENNVALVERVRTDE